MVSNPTLGNPKPLQPGTWEQSLGAMEPETLYPNMNNNGLKP